MANHLFAGFSDHTPELLERTQSNYQPLHSFALPKDRQHQQQFADIYFLRLTKIKPAVEEVATAAWEGTVLGGETATKVDRVLDVRQGQLCWVTGTVYMVMPLKPSVLEDVSQDVSGHCPSGERHLADPALALDLGPYHSRPLLLRGKWRGFDHARRRLRPHPARWEHP